MAQVDLASMFTELNKAIRVSDYKQVLKIANKIIHTKEGNNDEKAMHCKVVSMVYMNQFAEALKFIQSSPSINSTLIFEKAYCQYRLLHTEKALETIQECKELDIKLMELKAQILYKLGLYDESFKLYKNLMKECADDFEEERKTNLYAVHASISLWRKKKQTDLELQLNSYEQMYNKACKLLGDGRAVEGGEMLERAVTECQEYYEDDPDMTEEEIEGELAVIRVQMGYALQLQGREDEALNIYNQVIKSRPNDIGLMAIASNNIITINKEQNVFDSKKKMKATLIPGVSQKLVVKQLGMIEMNRALLYMYSNQWDACRKLLKTLQRDNRDSDIPCLIQAAQLCRERNFDKAISFLEDFIENHSDQDVHNVDLTHVKITLVQLLLGQAQVDRACKMIEGMEEIRHTPGIVSLLVALYDSRKGGEQRAINVLDEAVEWHRKNKSSNEILLKLMSESARYKLKRSRPKQAADTLENMRRLDPHNVKVLAQLIFAYSQFNPTKAHQISEDLPTLEEMSLSVNVEHLEKNAISLLAPRYIKRQAKQQQKLLDQKNKESEKEASGDRKDPKHPKREVVSEVRNDQVIKTEKKKRKKKKRLPQNYDPKAEPDPERWIPLRERSYYKGRRKDRRKGVGKGTQGSSTLTNETLDMSAKSNAADGSTPASPKPGSAAAPPNPPMSSPKPVSSGARPKSKQAGKSRKKKGKGGW